MATGIVLAAGRGARMKSELKKQYMELGGLPIVCHSLIAFDRCPEIDQLIMVGPEKDLEFCQDTILSHVSVETPFLLVAGGETRRDSVYNGLCAAENARWVAIHDGVRPLITPQLISQCLESAKGSGAAILGSPVFQTVKKVENGRILTTVDRDKLWLAQTPQAFSYEIVRRAHETAKVDDFFGTDDASLVERIGEPVSIVMGSRHNIKITTPEDLAMANALLGLMQEIS